MTSSGERDNRSEILEQLRRIRESPPFLKARRRCDLLSYLVGLAADGRQEEITEFSIAAAVYGRTSGFHPETDTIVRVELRRLRSSLEVFYADEGRDAPLVISIPKGSYTPCFTVRPVIVGSASVPPPVSSVAPPQPAVSTVSARPYTRLAAVALLLLSAVAAAITGSRYLRPDSELQQVTSLPGQQIEPAISPDGRQVAFAWDGEKQENLDIYIKRLRGGTRRLTTSPAQDKSPAWSPDGRQLAFLRTIPGNRQAVYVIPADGGAERLVTTIQTVVSGIAWTPDGANLVVPDSPHGVPLGLFLVSTTTGERRQLTEYRSCFHPAISPDRKTLAFVCDSEPGALSIVYLLPLTSNYLSAGTPVALKETLGPRVYFPSWSPDGRSLLYSSRVENNWCLFRLTLSTHTRERIRAVGVGVNHVTEIAPGQYLFHREREHSLIAKVWPGGSASTQPVPAFQTVEDDFYPDLSPDGHRLVFVSNRTGTPQLWIANPDGTNARRADSPGVFPERPRWTPDSQAVFFAGTTDRHSKIYRALATTGPAEALTLDDADDTNPTISQDGKWLYFISNRSGMEQIWRVALPSGAPELVVPDQAYYAEESPDGESLLYWSGSEIRRFSFKGRISTVLVENVPIDYYRVVAGGIYFETFISGERKEVRFQPFNPTAPAAVFSSRIPFYGWCPVLGQPYLLTGLRRWESNIEVFRSR